MNKKYTYLIIVLLILGSLIAFGRNLGNEFVNYDDDVYITENDHIKSVINTESIKWAFTSSHASNWHPLTWLSHMIDWQLFGANASGHHLVSLLLHIGGVILLFLFLNKTTGSLWPSAFVAALFALHPLRVESVAWAAERKDVLSLFLGLASIYAYAYYVESSKFSRYCISFMLFALSLMAKPMLVTLPFLLLLLDYWPLGRWQKALQPKLLPVSNDSGLVKKKGKQHKADSAKEEKISMTPIGRVKIISPLLWEKLPFILLAIGSSIVTFWAQSKGGSVIALEKLPLTDRILNAIVSYFAYLVKIFWPVNLAVLYPYEKLLPAWQVFGAGASLLAISIAVFYLIKKVPFLFVGWFWYLGTLIPVIGLVQVGIQSMADRYTYFPSIGIAIMLTWGVVYLSKEKLRKLIIIPVAIILASLTFLTWQQCGYWKNSIVLYDHVLKVTQNNDLVHYNLGNTLTKQRKNEEAIAHYREAIRINPYHDKAHTNLGIALDAEGNHDQGIAHYLSALKINPYNEKAHYNLAMAYMDQGQIEASLKHFQAALLSNPDFPDAHNNIGIILEMYFNKYDEAIYHYQQELKIKSDNCGTHFNLGIVLAKTGRLQEAIGHFQAAVNLKPDYEEARQALKIALEMAQKNR